MTIDHLAAQYMIPLRRSVMSVFMMRDGESVSPHDAAEVSHTIVDRDNHYHERKRIQRDS